MSLMMKTVKAAAEEAKEWDFDFKEKQKSI